MKKNNFLAMKQSHFSEILDLQTSHKLDLGRNIWQSCELKKIVNKKKTFAQVSVSKKKINGFAIFSKCGDYLELYSIFVHPDFRKNGIAKKFVKNGIIFCKKKSLKKIILEVNEKNFSAINLYLSLDFLICGRRSKYYFLNSKFSDAFLMSLKI